MTAPIGSITVTPIAGGKYRAFAWRERPTNEPAGSPIGTIDGDSLGHATFEMLRAIRGERGFDGDASAEPSLFDGGA